MKTWYGIKFLKQVYFSHVDLTRGSQTPVIILGDRERGKKFARNLKFSDLHWHCMWYIQPTHNILKTFLLYQKLGHMFCFCLNVNSCYLKLLISQSNFSVSFSK